MPGITERALRAHFGPSGQKTTRRRRKTLPYWMNEPVKSVVAEQIVPKVGTPVEHCKWGKGTIVSVDAASFQTAQDAPLVFVVVLFSVGEIYLPLSDLLVVADIR